MNKILVDTNILVYAFDESVVYHAGAKKTLELKKNLVLSQNTLLEFYRVMTSKPFQKIVSIEEVIQAKNFFRNNFEIIYPNNSTDIILDELINTYKPRTGQVWDYLLLAQALQNNINTVYTKNIKDFPENKLIKIIDPTL